MDQPTTKIPVRIPTDHHAALKADAQANDRSVAATIRRLVRVYLQHPERFDPPQPPL